MNEVITLEYENLDFEIELRKRITIIEGDSATGKTLMFKAFKGQYVPKSEINRFILIDYEDAGKSYDYVTEIISISEGKLIIIDNTEEILNSEIINMINNDRRNKYILIGRLMYEIKTSPNSNAELYYDKDENKFKLHYRYNKSRW